MTAENQSFVMHRGDDLELTVTVLDKAGDPVRVTAAEWRMAATLGGNAVVQKSSANPSEIEIQASPNDHQFKVFLAEADTDSLAAANYQHAARATDDSGNSQVVTTGKVAVRDRPQAAA